MATLSPSLIMIHGGAVGTEPLNDGVIINTETQSTVRTLSTGDFKISSGSNACCSTEYQAVLSVVKASRQRKLVEISATDGSVTVLKDL